MTFFDRQPDPADNDIADANAPDLPLSRLLGNFADEISVASAVCINVEEIIADRLIEGAPVSDYVRTELQNVDRLIQMLTDFRALVLHLSDTIEDRSVSRDGCRAVLMMEELRERLLAAEPTRKKTGEIPSSDVTIF